DVAPGPQVVVEPGPDVAPGPQVVVEPGPDVAPGPQVAVEPGPGAAFGPQVAVEPGPDVGPGPQVAVELAPGVASGPQVAVELGLGAGLVHLSLAYLAGDHERLAATAVAGAGLLSRLDHERLAARPLLRVIVLAGQATGHLCTGRLEEAAEAFAAGALAATGQRGCEPLLLYCVQHLALTEAHRGRLRTAHDAAQRALAVAGRIATIESRPAHHVADAALAWTAAEWYDLDTAWRHLLAAEAGLAAVAGRPQRDVYAATLALVRARLLRARGELPAALRALRRPHGGVWLRHDLAAAEVRVLIAMGRDQEAGAALSTLDPRHPDATLLRGLAGLAGGDPARAVECADRVLGDPGLPPAALVDAWLLLAAGVARQGDRDRAVEALRTASAYIAEQGGVRAIHESDVILRRLVREQDLPLRASREGL
ncbi:hypothetical protein AB0M46_41585, partial [Dactylosporangium sp. NPDC051485]